MWDFSGYTTYQCEAVPAKGDKKKATRWYWEAGHFKRELGDLILDRIFSRGAEINQFGALLTLDNIDSQITLMREQELGYRQNYAQDIEALEMIAVNIKSRQRKREQ